MGRIYILLSFLALVDGEDKCCWEYNLKDQCHDTSTRYLIDKAGADFVFSPLSISSLLQNIYLGSEGQLKKELEETLDIGHGEPPQLTDDMLEVYNAIVVDSQCCTPSQHFLDLMKGRGVKVITKPLALDSEKIRRELNADVARVTKGNIKDILPPEAMSTFTTLVVLNAVHFVGKWKYEFDKKKTKKMLFHQSLTESTMVDMMNVAKTKVVYRQIGDMELVSVPYKTENLFFAMIFSKKSDLTKLSAQALNKKVQSFGFDDTTAYLIQNHLRGKSVAEILARLTMPKFKIESSYDLKDHFNKAGKFENLLYPSTDLPGILGAKVRHRGVDYFTHKALITVDEEGTIASAATASGSSRSALAPQPLDIIIDRPFLFFVLDLCRARYLFSGSFNGRKGGESGRDRM